MSGRHRVPVSGRHQAVSGRHRAPAALLATERGRTVALSATLGAALLTGVAGGSAAASATSPSGHLRTSGPTLASSGASGAASPVASGAASAPAAGAASAPAAGVSVLAGGLAPADWEPTAGVAGAAPVRRKSRAAVQPAAAGGAAWVNPNPTAAVTSCFGPRWGRMHEGVDLAAPDGTPIVAAGAGVVVRAGQENGYGNAVLIDHGNGFLTHYGHLAVIAVAAGQHVTAGQQIGNEGSTGHSTGPHLHFEVHAGHYKNPVEPTRWMHERGVDIAGCAAG